MQHPMTTQTIQRPNSQRRALYQIGGTFMFLSTQQLLKRTNQVSRLRWGLPRRLQGEALGSPHRCTQSISKCVSSDLSASPVPHVTSTGRMNSNISQLPLGTVYYMCLAVITEITHNRQQPSPQKASGNGQPQSYKNKSVKHNDMAKDEHKMRSVNDLLYCCACLV